MAKKKRDLISTLETIERYHRRRSVFTIHIVFSLAFQFAMWANWFASYAIRGVGFESNFFSSRFIISIVFFMLLAGHYAFMRQMESKDRLIIEALREHAAAYEALYGDDDEEEDEATSDAASKINRPTISPDEAGAEQRSRQA